MADLLPSKDEHFIASGEVMSDFRELFECQFTLSESDELLLQLAERYCQETESFDRMVCTGPIIEGSVMPVTNWQRQQVARNAGRLFQTILELNPQISSRELRRAIAARQ